MADTIKHVSLRINENTLKKFRYICAYEGRSINRQLLVYIREVISEYEREHGEIDLENLNQEESERR